MNSTGNIPGDPHINFPLEGQDEDQEMETVTDYQENANILPLIDDEFMSDIDSYMETQPMVGEDIILRGLGLPQASDDEYDDEHVAFAGNLALSSNPDNIELDDDDFNFDFDFDVDVDDLDIDDMNFDDINPESGVLHCDSDVTFSVSRNDPSPLPDDFDPEFAINGNEENEPPNPLNGRVSNVQEEESKPLPKKRKEYFEELHDFNALHDALHQNIMAYITPRYPI